MTKPVPPRPSPAGPPATVEEVLALVRARGGRTTSARRVILESIFAAGDHLTAEEIGEAVRARAPDVHMSTVYRNLDDLQRLGVVVHSHLGHGPSTYQLATTAHAHFICESCGVSFQAPDELFSQLSDQALSRFGFAIDPHHFAILGHCADCTA